MRVEYLDHFGVHVVERKVELRSDDTVDRDAKSFKANVDGNGSTSKYRSGITYTGEFTLADGRRPRRPATISRCSTDPDLFAPRRMRSKATVSSFAVGSPSSFRSRVNG